MLTKLLYAALGALWRHVDIQKDGQIAIRRWFVTPRLYLHHIRQSDNDPDPHDHPWDFTTLILWGGYLNHMYTRGRGARCLLMVARTKWLHVYDRNAEHCHQVKLSPGRTAWTLVSRGKYRRRWGFIRPTGWVFWREHLGFWKPDPFDPGNEAWEAACRTPGCGNVTVQRQAYCPPCEASPSRIVDGLCDSMLRDLAERAP